MRTAGEPPLCINTVSCPVYEAATAPGIVRVLPLQLKSKLNPRAKLWSRGGGSLSRLNRARKIPEFIYRRTVLQLRNEHNEAAE